MTQYNPTSQEPYKISRSKIDLFVQCPRCFWLDQVKGIKRPSGPAFTLNTAVDELLKKEFDLLRKKGESHELMKKYNIDALPYDHPDLPLWRGEVNRFSGARAFHSPTNLIIDGLVDDIWQDSAGDLLIVDYKATSTIKEISLDDPYKVGYKRQAEIYQWIFRQMGFPVSDYAYFVFANAGKNRPSFDGKLEFEMTIIEHKGDDSWVEPKIFEAKKCLDRDNVPEVTETCEHCMYTKSVGEITK